MNDVSGQPEATSSAMERAREVEENLCTKFPSFVKPMIPSNVMGGFWLSLPKIFCKLHLPEHDTVVVLVDENGEEYHVKYLPDRRGLSGGWRGFSIAHKLVEGDVLVFQLIKNYKFKVYIVRANGLDEVDGALGLLQLDAHRQRRSPGLITETTNNADEVKACQLASFPDDFALWEKRLTNFEQLRSNFELISARLEQLVCHAADFKLEALQHKECQRIGDRSRLCERTESS